MRTTEGCDASCSGRGAPAAPLVRVTGLAAALVSPGGLARESREAARTRPLPSAAGCCWVFTIRSIQLPDTPVCRLGLHSPRLTAWNMPLVAAPAPAPAGAWVVLWLVWVWQDERGLPDPPRSDRLAPRAHSCCSSPMSSGSCWNAWTSLAAECAAARTAGCRSPGALAGGGGKPWAGSELSHMRSELAPSACGRACMHGHEPSDRVWQARRAAGALQAGLPTLLPRAGTDGLHFMAHHGDGGFQGRLLTAGALMEAWAPGKMEGARESNPQRLGACRAVSSHAQWSAQLLCSPGRGLAALSPGSPVPGEPSLG
jgi:hypothetical protein